MTPITCDKATMLLERRWDHALKIEEESALDAHLEACAVCRAEAEAIAMADAAFLHLEELEPPVNIVAAVAQQIAEEAPAEPRRGLFWGTVAVLAAVFATFWHFGITPMSVAQSPVLAALLDPIGHTVATWLRPVTIFLGALTPALGNLPRYAAIPLLLELVMLTVWAVRRSQRSQGRRASDTSGAS